MKRLTNGLFGLVFFWGILTFCVLAAAAQETPAATGEEWEGNDNFRVNNKIMFAEKSEIVSSGKTLFCDGNIYDFVDNSDEIAVFNPSQKKIYILDMKNRRKFTTSPEEVEQYVTKLCDWGMNHPKEEIRQFFQPNFTTKFDNKKNEYSFISTNFSYFVTPIRPERPEILEQYRYFARLSCRVNMMLSPGSKTLYARSIVNETVFNAGSLIQHLQLSIREQKGMFSSSTVLLSEYLYLPRLVNSDRETIRQIEDSIVLFQDGTLEEFQTRRLNASKRP